MSISNVETIELTGMAYVKVKRTLTVSRKKARRILGSDKQIMEKLSENMRDEVIEWDMVYGMKEPVADTEENQAVA